MGQQTTRRVQASSTAAKNKIPVQAGVCVMSATCDSSGRSTVKSRLIGSGAGCALECCRVATVLRHRPKPLKPTLRISRAIRLRAAQTPCSCNSAWMRGGTIHPVGFCMDRPNTSQQPHRPSSGARLRRHATRSSRWERRPAPGTSWQSDKWPGSRSRKRRDGRRRIGLPCELARILHQGARRPRRRAKDQRERGQRVPHQAGSNHSEHKPLTNQKNQEGNKRLGAICGLGCGFC